MSGRLGLTTDAMVEGASVVRQRVAGGTVCTTPACPHTHWGHRVETDAPPWDGLGRWLRIWRGAHDGTVAQAVFAWESDTVVAAPTLPRGVDVARFSAMQRRGPSPAPRSVVRRLGPERATDLRRMAQEVNGMDGSASSQAYLDWYWGRAFRWVEAGRSARFGVEVDGELAASCGLVWSGGVARFQDVMTRAAHRRRGFATDALRAAIRERRAREPATRFVIVAERGGPAEALYGRVGFATRSTSVVLTVPKPRATHSPKPQPPRSG